MAIPDFQTLMLPLLRIASDQKTHALAHIREQLAKQFDLTAAELEDRLRSGQSKFANRVSWAKAHLGMAGLLDSPTRGHICITLLGLSVFSRAPQKITIKFLEQFESYQNSRRQSSSPVPMATHECAEPTPEEVMESAYQQMRQELAERLLRQTKETSWEFFETLVVKLLVAMGYGGTIKDAGQSTQKTADEGIDGIIKQDRLGLDIIYLQAKRWENVVGRPEIQKFVGALHGQRAKKGIFITTSRFSSEATEYACHVDPKVVLIDGKELAQLMIDYDLGVSSVDSYVLKRLDTDFFLEE